MRIENGNIRLEDDEELSFGNDDDARIYWDSELGELVGATISGGTGTASAFTDLTDVPAAYTGEAGKSVVVNATEDGLEFITNDIVNDTTPELGGTLNTNGKPINLNAYATPTTNLGKLLMTAGILSTTRGDGNGIILCCKYTGATPVASGTLVSIQHNATWATEIFPTDFVNYPNKPAFGVALRSDSSGLPTIYGFQDVVVYGGVSGKIDLGANAADKGALIYVDPTSTSGTYTLTKPTTPGQSLQVVGKKFGTNYNWFVNPQPDVDIVGAQLPATWRFVANGNDLELRFNDGDSWNLITTFSGTTE